MVDPEPPFSGPHAPANPTRHTRSAPESSGPGGALALPTYGAVSPHLSVNVAVLGQNWLRQTNEHSAGRWPEAGNLTVCRGVTSSATGYIDGTVGGELNMIAVIGWALVVIIVVIVLAVIGALSLLRGRR
jgi:hypothetical protein